MPGIRQGSRVRHITQDKTGRVKLKSLHRYRDTGEHGWMVKWDDGSISAAPEGMLERIKALKETRDE